MRSRVGHAEGRLISSQFLLILGRYFHSSRRDFMGNAKPSTLLSNPFYGQPQQERRMNQSRD